MLDRTAKLDQDGISTIALDHGVCWRSPELRAEELQLLPRAQAKSSTWYNLAVGRSVPPPPPVRWATGGGEINKLLIDNTLRR